MTYTVKEIFKTLQGEGAHAGTVAVFCRFAGCNLWSGLEENRTTARCTFCDTDFVGGKKYGDYEALADAIADEWGDADNAKRFAVLTGGEPLLQVDHWLVGALKKRGFYVAVETNGTQVGVEGIDWYCVSPKTRDITKDYGDELKFVYPQENLTPSMFSHMRFSRFLLSPMDGPQLAANTQAAIDYCLRHPQWRLTLQMHKLVGIR